MRMASQLVVPVISVLLVSAAQAQYLPGCAEHPFKVPITYWEPELIVDDWLASSAPTGDGRVVYIWAVFDSGDVACELGGDDSLTLRDGEPLAGIDEPGESIHIRGGVVYDSGMCKVSGYYINEYVPGMQHGWTDTFFERLDSFSVVSSGTFCLENSPEYPH